MTKEIATILGLGALWVLGCIAVLALSGCVVDPQPPKPIPIPADPSALEVEQTPGANSYSTGGTVREIKLQDGTRCAVTFWGKQDLRRVLYKAIDALDVHYGSRVKP